MRILFWGAYHNSEESYKTYCMKYLQVQQNIISTAPASMRSPLIEHQYHKKLGAMYNISYGNLLQDVHQMPF
jgi:hypothetical protein